MDREPRVSYYQSTEIGRGVTLGDLEPNRLPVFVYTLRQLDAPFSNWLSRESQKSMATILYQSYLEFL